MASRIRSLSSLHRHLAELSIFRTVRPWGQLGCQRSQRSDDFAWSVLGAKRCHLAHHATAAVAIKARVEAVKPLPVVVWHHAFGFVPGIEACGVSYRIPQSTWLAGCLGRIVRARKDPRRTFRTRQF